MAVLRDITEQYRDRAELTFLAEHDPLTGVANRRRIGSRIADCAADPAGGALLMIDIDNFKDINDLRGHAVGDLIIRRVASTVAAQIGPDALLGRLGGDEFAVIVPGASPRRGDGAGRAALRHRGGGLGGGSDAVRHGQHRRRPRRARASPPTWPSPRPTWRVYAAKGAGRNRARLFTDELYQAAAQRVSLLQRVGAALDEGTMRLFAQPIVDLRHRCWRAGTSC